MKMPCERKMLKYIPPVMAATCSMIVLMLELIFYRSAWTGYGEFDGRFAELTSSAIFEHW
ncbi:protein of unknown function [Pseudodesulfovibrio piezophilus C1TLV30]|uniref:Uncharacterized protein n=1 Tax=Pseudodesulfovibrio piezophilus (strain DSM 21447 / JCM 15486 / C1TLV30) TaxID=1322246 RepID=M1WR61_PSEP2|nr:protein of unknown function [Pseudodesulfovibrio piezophilus C1TLV30]